MNKIGLHRSQHIETASLSYWLYTDHSNPATRGTYCSFIFRGNNPYFSCFGVQPKILLSERQHGGVRVSDTVSVKGFLRRPLTWCQDGSNEGGSIEEITIEQVTR